MNSGDSDRYRSIYLAGPIEQSEDPRSWRDVVKERHPDVEFVDPMDWQDEWRADPQACIAKELTICERHPILACNIGRDAPRTVGTHHEIAHALAHGNERVAVVPNGELPGFIEHRDVLLFDDPGDAVRALAGKAEPVTDGGMVRELNYAAAVERGYEWLNKAEENVDEWGEQSVETLLLATQEELGELTQAVLEYRAEDGYYGAIYEELNDLGPLLFQLFWAINRHDLHTGNDSREVEP